MRRLRITIDRTKAGAPALIAALVVPAAACDCDAPTDPMDGGGGATISTTTAAGGAGQGGAGGITTTFVTSTSTGAGGQGGELCGDAEQQQTFEVELPPAGTPADPGQICAAPDPVDSSGAGRVVLMVGAEAHLATGMVTVPAAVAAKIIGAPIISVLEASVPELLPVTITDVAVSASGFTFQAAFPQPFTVDPMVWARVTFEVRFTLDCAPDPSRTVRALTYVQLCDELGGVGWVSSGDDCNVCSIIAEMAPSPIVPERKADDLGLAFAIRLRVREVARIGRARVLFAENDGGEGVEYAWKPSGGTLTSLAPDIVLWEPPATPGPHQVQASVIAEDGAAVSSFLLKEVA